MIKEGKEIQLETIEVSEKVENLPKQNYEKICKIGYGAFGCVYKVQVKNEEETKIYALKKFFLDSVYKY